MKQSDFRILFADDEEMIRNIFKGALKTWGYEADVAKNGVDALEKCAKKTYHLIITDLNMPCMDGMGLLKRIKQNFPTMEIMVVTGYGTIETAIEAMKSGASEFILKPVNFDHVKTAINRCFQKTKAMQENVVLRNQIAELRELNEMKDKFIAITNHEIRTPLTIIRGYLEILEMVFDDLNLADDEKEIMQILKSTTQDLNQTVEKMHVLSRSGNTSWDDAIETVSLSAVAQEVYNDLKGLYKHRNVELEYLHPQIEIWTRGTQKGIKIVLQELLQNALKYTPDNGQVNFSISTKSENAIICVADNGIGIPFEKQKLVFSPFYEVQPVIKHKSSNCEFMGGGMGIGLPLVREIVSALHGEISLESEPEKGSTFSISLAKVNQTILEKKTNVAI